MASSAAWAHARDTLGRAPCTAGEERLFEALTDLFDEGECVLEEAAKEYEDETAKLEKENAELTDKLEKFGDAFDDDAKEILDVLKEAIEERQLAEQRHEKAQESLKKLKAKYDDYERKLEALGDALDAEGKYVLDHLRDMHETIEGHKEMEAILSRMLKTKDEKYDSLDRSYVQLRNEMLAATKGKTP